MEKIDRKFRILAMNPVNGKSYTEADSLLLCAKDAAVPATLLAYAEECLRLGANPEHIDSAYLLHGRVVEFQKNAGGGRVPDTIGDEIPRCLHGVESSVDQREIVNLTCAYCGKAYMDGTPSHGSQILTDHIKVCEKHPLRDAEAAIAKLRSALAGLVGVDGKEELKAMEAMIRLADAPAKDKAVTIDAIHVLLETPQAAE